MKKISITHFNNAHGDWLRSLDFYKQELALLRERLTGIAGKNSHQDVLKQVEHFENQFALQAENMDILSHEIKANVAAIAGQAHESAAGYVDGAFLAQHNMLGSEFQREEKVINELRHSFNLFSSEWM